MSEQYLVEMQYINNMIYNKQVSQDKERSYGEVLVEFGLVMFGVLLAYVYLIALN